MKTYYQKLNDYRWHEFREHVFSVRGRNCETCGGDGFNGEQINVHHTKYIRGNEPWEYDIEDVRVYCRQCHEEIHECEEAWRNFIRALPSHYIKEFQSLVSILKNIEPKHAEFVASHCKNEAMKFLHVSDHNEQTNRKGVNLDLAIDWAKRLLANLEGSR